MSRPRRILVAGNWKMHKTPSESQAFAATLRRTLPSRADQEIVVFPTAVCLPAVTTELAGSHIACGAQNSHWEPEGPFTGELSLRSLAEVGCRYVLVGHSERRVLFGETDETCALKVRATLNLGLTPVFCCGETLTHREQNETVAVVERQLQEALSRITSPLSLVVAYEPVWAIGTGRTATPSQVTEAHTLIRRWLEHRFAAEGAGVRIIYGGSVRPDNIETLMLCDDVDGVLVGGASLDIASFSSIVRACR